MSFMTILTSCTSCQRNQVKSRNHGKTHIFQHQKTKLKHQVVTIVVKEGKSQISDQFQVIKVQPLKPNVPVGS